MLPHDQNHVIPEAETPSWQPLDDRLDLPEVVPLPPHARLGQNGIGDFSSDEGIRVIVAELGQAEVWSCQIGDGRLVQQPFVAIPSDICETGWSPSRARAVAADVLAAADLAEAWQSWAPDAGAVTE